MNNKFFKQALSKALATVLTVSTLIATTNFAFAADDISTEVDRMEPIKTNNLIVNLKKNSTHPLGRIPTTFSIKKSNKSSLRKSTNLNLPSKFDLRTVNRITPVKDQGNIGACWSFATCGALESELKTIGGEEKDFSEDNIITQSGFSWGYAEGGNRNMATAYLARWNGPVLEQDDLYPNPAEENNIVNNGAKETKKVFAQ